jgi:hypothetical protein
VDKEFREDSEGCGIECENESEPCGTATLFRRTLSEMQKSLSAKCLLHKKYLYIIFAESILHGCPTFSAHTLALERKKKHYITNVCILKYFQSGRFG